MAQLDTETQQHLTDLQARRTKLAVVVAAAATRIKVLGVDLKTADAARVHAEGVAAKAAKAVGDAAEKGDSLRKQIEAATREHAEAADKLEAFSEKMAALRSSIPDLSPTAE